MVGNRAMGGVVVGISFFATFARPLYRSRGQGYAYGFLSHQRLLVIFSWVSWRWVGPPMRRFASAWDALTIPTFGEPLFLAPLLSVIHSGSRGGCNRFLSLLYCSRFSKAQGIYFSFFERGLRLAVGITLVIVMLYTSIGGFVSVVRTDVIQGYHAHW